MKYWFVKGSQVFLATCVCIISSCKGMESAGWRDLLLIASGSMKHVYIDPDMPVSGDGSKDQPYKCWADISFEPGTVYLQKRGTTAREEIIISVSGTSSRSIVLGAYGTGDLPRIYGSELETGWSVVPGYTSLYSKAFDSSCKLGMVAEDGTALSFKIWKSDVATTFSGAVAGSYALDHDAGTIYVWCSGDADPNTRQMEVSRRYRGIAVEGASHVVIRDLAVRYASLNGIDIGACGIINECTGGEACTGCIVENCIVSDCGGAWFGPPYNYNLGNGIQIANTARQCSIRGCTVSDIFDSGISPQVYADGQAQSDISITGCEVRRCGFSGIEVAALDNGGSTGSITGMVLREVAVEDSGKGWSGDRSETYGSPQAAGVKICADEGSFLSGVRMERSSITGSRGNAVWIFGDTGVVSLARVRMFDNEADGIVATDGAAESSLRLDISSSLIYGNGMPSNSAILFNVPHGGGFRIYHTTFFNNAGIALFSIDDGGTSELKNNIFSTPGVAHIVYQNVSGFEVIDYNCYYGTGSGGLFIGYNGMSYTTLTSFNVATGKEGHGLEVDPLFSDAGSDLFTLQSGSPCAGSGDGGVDVTCDFDGRSYANPPSLGAYEMY